MSIFRALFDSSNHVLSESVWHIWLLSLIWTQNRDKVTLFHCFYSKLRFLFSNQITRSWITFIWQIFALKLDLQWIIWVQLRCWIQKFRGTLGNSKCRLEIVLEIPFSVSNIWDFFTNFDNLFQNILKHALWRFLMSFIKSQSIFTFLNILLIFRKKNPKTDIVFRDQICNGQKCNLSSTYVNTLIFFCLL